MKQRFEVRTGSDNFLVGLHCTAERLEEFITWANARREGDLRVYGFEADGLPVLLFPNDHKGERRE